MGAGEGVAAAEDEEKKEGLWVSILGCVVLITGVFLCVISYNAVKQQGMEDMDQLVSFQADWQVKVRPMTTYQVLKWLKVVSWLVIVAGILGILGGIIQKKRIICVHTTLAAVLTVLMIMSACYTLQRRLKVAPLIMEQVGDLCDSDRYMKFAKHIGCSFASRYEESEVGECNEACQVRADLLEKHGGCLIMESLCKHFNYNDVDTDCLSFLKSANNGNAMYYCSQDEEQCRADCNDDIMCNAYAYSAPSDEKPQICLLGQAVAKSHTNEKWFEWTEQDEQDMVSPMECYNRTDPQVLGNFRKIGTHIAVCTLALSVVLAAATCCSCCHLYNLILMRRGLPTAVDLSLMMCCPCCAGHVKKKLLRPVLTDSDEEDDSSE